MSTFIVIGTALLLGSTEKMKTRCLSAREAHKAHWKSKPYYLKTVSEHCKTPPCSKQRQCKGRQCSEVERVAWVWKRRAPLRLLDHQSPIFILLAVWP